MSENIISQETAENAVKGLFDYFDVEHVDDDGEKRKEFKPLVKAVEKGRVEISTNTDGDPEIIQHFKKAIDGNKSAVWDWTRLGLAKRAITMKETGIQPFDQYYDMAAKFFKVPKEKILNAHPVDLSLIEVIGSFFRAI